MSETSHPTLTAPHNQEGKEEERAHNLLGIEGIERISDIHAAGRDRTGLLAGILHHIAGTSTDDVIYDYMLSRIGLEPLRGHIAIVAKQMGLSEEETQGDGFFHVSSLRPSYWTTFLGALEETYGGWDGYIRHLGFNDEDVQRIKANIT